MLKVYLLSYDESQISRDDLVEVIDGNTHIVNWMTMLTSSALIVSELDVKSLANEINRDRPKPFRYILTAVDERGGWLPKTTWEFIKSPKRAE